MKTTLKEWEHLLFRISLPLINNLQWHYLLLLQHKWWNQSDFFETRDVLLWELLVNRKSSGAYVAPPTSAAYVTAEGYKGGRGPFGSSEKQLHEPFGPWRVSFTQNFFSNGPRRLAFPPPASPTESNRCYRTPARPGHEQVRLPGGVWNGGGRFLFYFIFFFPDGGRQLRGRAITLKNKTKQNSSFRRHRCFFDPRMPTVAWTAMSRR